MAVTEVPSHEAPEGVVAVPSTDAWLGGEPNLLELAVEKKGVEDILAALTEEELNEMKDKTMPIRHFRAEKGNTAKAIEKLGNTLKWRKEFRVDDIVNCMQEGGDEEIRKRIVDEHDTGILKIRGYDAQGRAIICINPTAPKTGNELAQLQTLVYLLEKAVACTVKKTKERAGGPLQKVVAVSNYDGFTAADRGPLKTVKGVIHILSNHYPERLSGVYLIHPPMVFRVFWTLVRPFMDPVTKEKFAFCVGENAFEQFTYRVADLDKLEPRFGGTGDVRPFDTQEYLNLPLGVCFDE